MTFGTTTLAGISAAGTLVASVFLSPPSYVYGVTGLLVMLASAGYMVMKQWEISEPNEWLLLIENGKLVKAGIGLKTFVWPYQTVVKFPSKIERITFSAQNVTKEMQGLEVTGFAIWSVHREADGPFKCYKYTQGGDANENVRTMCESIVRHQIANHTLKEVLCNRNALRDSMKADLQKQLSGWGIWLETVEITEVKICSNSLFEDMQAEYRQETHLHAEQIRLDSQSKVEQNKLQSDFLLNKNRIDTETQRIQYQGDEVLKRQVQETKVFQHKCDLDIQKLKKEQEVQLQKLEQEFAVSTQRKVKEMEAEQLRKEFELRMFQRTFEVEGLMTPIALQKYVVDSTERIYNKLPLKEISINSYIGPENTGNIASFLPALGMMQQQNAQAFQNAQMQNQPKK